MIYEILAGGHVGILNGRTQDGQWRFGSAVRMDTTKHTKMGIRNENTQTGPICSLESSAIDQSFNDNSTGAMARFASDLVRPYHCTYG